MKGAKRVKPLWMKTGAEVRRDFPGMSRTTHTLKAADAIAQEVEAKKVWDRLRADAIAKYGRPGATISSGVSDIFPDGVNDSIRDAAASISEMGELAFAHWRAAGRQAHTFRRMRDEAYKKARTNQYGSLFDYL